MKISNVIASKLPDGWELQRATYKSLLEETNRFLSSNSDEAVDCLFELIWGTLEYLEADTRKIAQSQKVVNNPRIKLYQEQLLNLMNALEELSQQGKYIPDRYVLYLDVFQKLIYIIDIEGALFFISNFLERVSKFNVKKTSKEYYFNNFINFLVEIALIAFQSKNIKTSSYIFLMGTNLIEQIDGGYSGQYLKPILGLAITLELQGNFQEATNAYLKCLESLITIDTESISIQIINEVAVFGYICSFLGDLKKDYLKNFYKLQPYCTPEVGKLLTELHTIVQYGFIGLLDVFEDFNDVADIPKTLDYFLLSSIVSSSQKNNKIALRHLSADWYLPELVKQINQRGADRGILIVESEFLKDIQVFVGKHLLPSLNVIPSVKSSYVKINNYKINVKRPFVLGTEFEGEIEINIHYKKNKGLIKRKFSVKDALPAVMHIDVTSELKEARLIREGGIKYLGGIYLRDMTLLEVIKNIANIPVKELEFNNDEKERKEILKNFTSLFKRLGRKKEEKLFTDMGELTSSVSGKALKLVILQRLSTLEDSDEIDKVIKNAAQN
ncbi:MAG: hypothetical protein ACXAC7_12975 [Candidatus Hodarchaeales archaeon]